MNSSGNTNMNPPPLSANNNNTPTDPFAGMQDLQMTSNFPEDNNGVNVYAVNNNMNMNNNTINNGNANAANTSSGVSATQLLKQCTACVRGCVLGTFTFLRGSSHPIPAAFHIIFKIIALTIYIFGGFFEKNGFVTIAVICILCHACDFWVVKNVTGRLLVGLRWWNKVNPDDGSTEWLYESALQDQSQINKVDSNYFWSVLYLTPLIWSVLGFLCIIKLNISWFLIVICALTLNGANLYGYWMCSKDQKQKLKEMMAQGAFSAASSAFTNGLFGFGSNDNSYNNSQQQYNNQQMPMQQQYNQQMPMQQQYNQQMPMQQQYNQQMPIQQQNPANAPSTYIV